MFNLLVAFILGVIVSGAFAVRVTLTRAKDGLAHVPSDFHILFREKLTRHEGWAHIAIMPALAPENEQSIESMISNEKMNVSTVRLPSRIPLTAWVFDAEDPTERIVETFEFFAKR